MSVWTQVVGCIRVDGIPGLNDDYTVEAFKQKLGPICTWDDWNELSTLPRGSEGSLWYDILSYDTGSEEYGILPTGVIPIYGSLRDYDSVEEITEWWHETLSKFHIVRDGVLRIEVGHRTLLEDRVTILQYTAPRDDLLEELYLDREE